MIALIIVIVWVIGCRVLRQRGRKIPIVIDFLPALLAVSGIVGYSAREWTAMDEISKAKSDGEIEGKEEGIKSVPACPLVQAPVAAVQNPAVMSDQPHETEHPEPSMFDDGSYDRSQMENSLNSN